MIYTIEYWVIDHDCWDDRIVEIAATSPGEAIEKVKKKYILSKHHKILTQFTRDEKLETTTSSE